MYTIAGSSMTHSCQLCSRYFFTRKDKLLFPAGTLFFAIIMFPFSLSDFATARTGPGDNRLICTPHTVLCPAKNKSRTIPNEKSGGFCQTLRPFPWL